MDNDMVELYNYFSSGEDDGCMLDYADDKD